MPKVCVACGLAVDEPQKLPSETEDCPGCGGVDTVEPEKTGDGEETVGEEEEGV